jgi:hypothetical protein
VAAIEGSRERERRWRAPVVAIAAMIGYAAGQSMVALVLAFWAADAVSR